MRILFATGFALLLAFGSGAFAQEVNATLNGSVADPSGATVQGASVLIHNNDTNTDFRTVMTDASGTFTVTSLPPAVYTVTVKASGFRTFLSSNVVLHVAEKRSLPVDLQTGQVSETVNVTEASIPVQTSTSAQAGTITGTQVRELQLNNRNFEQLVTLQPGVTSGLPDIINFGISNTSSVVINGARTGANNWTVDGADINDSGSNSTLLNVPSVDAIQEFTLARSGYDAQYGRSGGGQILTVTKSGTSQFHGDLYEFVRNDKFNANSFFSNLVGAKKPPLRYNDYGFTIGGPLFIPKLYSRKESQTFFFWSEEWRKTGQPSSNTAVVPTAGALNGTFTGVVLNPASAPAGCVTNTTPGNKTTNVAQINPACFSNKANLYIQDVYSKFPANAGNGTQYISNTVAKNNYRQDIVRLDQNITDKIHAFGRFMQDQVPTTEPGGLFASSPLPNIFSTATNAPGRNIVANVSWAISPTVVNEAAFNYSWGAINSNLTGITNSPAVYGPLSGGLPFQDPYGRISGVTIDNIASVASPSAPYFERNIDKQIYDNFSKVLGSHTLRVGVTAQWMTKTENGPNPTNGTFRFINTPDGYSSFANFLIGRASQFTQSSRDIIPHLNYTNIEAYAQDDWKVTPRVTLNFGLRYSFFPTATDSNNVLNNFDSLAYNPAAAPALNPANGVFANPAVKPSNYVNGIIFPQGSACAAAQQLAPVTCSPFSDYVNPNSNKNFAPRFGFAWDVTGKGTTAVRGGYGVFYDRTLNGIWEQNAFGDPPLVTALLIQNTTFDNPAGSAASPRGPSNLTATGSPTFKNPSYQSYSFSIQQQVSSNAVFEIAYVGTQGRHLLGDVDLNQPSLAARQANPTVDVNLVRPYTGFAAITSRSPVFISNYNSLQTTFNRRVGNGLTLGVVYTWSKNLTNNPADRNAADYNSYNYAADYGPASMNTPHIGVGNFVYVLPFLKDQKGVAGHLLGGWELSGIVRLQSGQSVTIRQNLDPFRASDWPVGSPGVYPGGIGIDVASIAPRPNYVGGTSITGQGSRQQWFNPGAFTDAIGQFGNVGRGTILTPGIENWDLAGIKNIKAGERVSLQFRGELFNAFNHTNLTGLGVNLDTKSTFGQLTTSHLPRQIQLGLKLYF